MISITSALTSFSGSVFQPVMYLAGSGHIDRVQELEAAAWKATQVKPAVSVEPRFKNNLTLHLMVQIATRIRGILISTRVTFLQILSSFYCCRHYFSLYHFLLCYCFVVFSLVSVKNFNETEKNKQLNH